MQVTHHSVSKLNMVPMLQLVIARLRCFAIPVIFEPFGGFQGFRSEDFHCSSLDFYLKKMSVVNYHMET